MYQTSQVLKEPMTHSLSYRKTAVARLGMGLGGAVLQVPVLSGGLNSEVGIGGILLDTLAIGLWALSQLQFCPSCCLTSA